MVGSRKRKREHVGGGDGGDDDGDATYGLRQILPVANLPIDFDGEPTDGMQYLFTVRYVLSITSLKVSRTRLYLQARCAETTQHQVRRQSLHRLFSTACHHPPFVRTHTKCRGALTTPKQRMAQQIRASLS